jgi:lysophospholipase L1-like esterase
MARAFIHIFSLICGFVALVTCLTIVIGLIQLLYNRQSFASYWQGRNNQEGSFTLAVIGDSAAQSLGASAPEKGYVGLLAEHIQQVTGRSVRVINLSKSGATTHDALVQQVPRLARYDNQGTGLDLVLVEIGANDMKQYNAESFAKDYEQLLQDLPPGKAIVTEAPVFGARRRNLTPRIEAANQTIHNLADKYKLPVVPLYTTLRTRQSPWIYASDLFHPNNRGYQIWYSAFQPVVDSRLRSLNDGKLDMVEF